MNSGKAALRVSGADESAGLAGAERAGGAATPHAPGLATPAGDGRRGRVMARDPFSTDDILAGFYNPGRLREGRAETPASAPPAAPERPAVARATTPLRRPSEPPARAQSVPPRAPVVVPLPASRAPQPEPAEVPEALHALPEGHDVQDEPVMPAQATPSDADEVCELPPEPVAAESYAEPAGRGVDGASLRAAQAKPKPTHYKIVCISLYTEDIARLEAMVSELKRRGHSKANKSQLIRHALEQVDLDKVPRSG